MINLIWKLDVSLNVFIKLVMKKVYNFFVFNKYFVMILFIFVNIMVKVLFKIYFLYLIF